jgi:hypothetical protein
MSSAFEKVMIYEGNEPVWKLMLWALCAMVAIPILIILLPFAWLYTKMFQP